MARRSGTRASEESLECLASNEAHGDSCRSASLQSQQSAARRKTLHRTRPKMSQPVFRLLRPSTLQQWTSRVRRSGTLQGGRRKRAGHELRRGSDLGYAARTLSPLAANRADSEGSSSGGGRQFSAHAWRNQVQSSSTKRAAAFGFP